METVMDLEAKRAMRGTTMQAIMPLIVETVILQIIMLLITVIAATKETATSR